MASKAFLIAIIVVGIAAPKAFATDYVVGWALGVNYTAWAEGKDFYVGDRLSNVSRLIDFLFKIYCALLYVLVNGPQKWVFQYAEGTHNVYKVNGTAFQQCTVPPPSEALTSGNDVITLATPGRKWYVCGVGKHCVNGMKLVIIVYPVMAPASARLQLRLRA
ncbi:hypothetical protein DH2020_028666 [Rehmannia glutinosa]|uniref:Phytocyanin domain-containing protein n=1 Tax=Rehmannia glutinosa TaxID=99300 RepID=A0ABR0VQR0_REHGL